MKVIIAGSRDIKDIFQVHNFINKSPFKITEVISGGAAGVDKIGEMWARDHGVPIITFTPHYHSLNPIVAPLLRNVDMAKHADALIAVWKDESKGTKHMIDQMDKLKKPYIVLQIYGNEVVKEWQSP
jgi:hypothetical protein